jgi:hypothetical protein
LRISKALKAIPEVITDVLTEVLPEAIGMCGLAEE